MSQHDQSQAATDYLSKTLCKLGRAGEGAGATGARPLVRCAGIMRLVVNKAVEHWILFKRRGEHPTSVYCHAITRIVLLPVRAAPRTSWAARKDPHLSCLCEL
jgi:hypothetical protein